MSPFCLPLYPPTCPYCISIFFQLCRHKAQFMQPVTTQHADTLQKLNRAQITKYLFHITAHGIKANNRRYKRCKIHAFIIFLNHVKFFFKGKNSTLIVVVPHKTLQWVLFLSL
jgi:hypothetical protein